MKKRYDKRPAWDTYKNILCPYCLEPLYRVYIESYKKCPYCNTIMDSEQEEVEEFILKSDIDRWVVYQNFATGEFNIDLFSKLRDF